MSRLPAISLHQPWASLILVGAKGWETRSRPCPPKYIGQRVAIHAAKRRPDASCFNQNTYGAFDCWNAANIDDEDRPEHWVIQNVNDPDAPLIPVPLGAVVVTAVITASLPIYHIAQMFVSGGKGALWPNIQVNGPGALGVCHADDTPYESIVDQQLVGDFTPGRFAWELRDVEPVDPPVPWKGRQGWFQVDLP